MSDPTPPNPAPARKPIWAAPPPNVEAGVSEVPYNPDEPITWWRPGWSELQPHLGWRMIFLLPLAACVVLAGLGLWKPRVGMLFLGVGVKFLLFAAAVAISLAAYVLRRATQVRGEPFCIHCGYNLTGLPDDYRCPDCGRPYKWRIINEYRRDPQWFITRWYAVHKLPKPADPFAAGRRRGRARRRDGT